MAEPTEGAHLEPTMPRVRRAAEGQPKTIGRFSIVRKLGEGGMGVVYEGYDAELDRKVAIKLVRVGSGAAARARLFREAQAMAKVTHPNVAPVYEVGGIADRVYVAMELVEGETLSTWLRREARPWSDILAMFVAAGRGLAAAHERGIVHRDFKPDNVLVGRDRRPRVVDFGLARSRGDEAPADVSASSALDTELTEAGTLLGTPAYMSPEHFNGHAVDPRSDQFGFAVALYRGLFRDTPFDGDNVQAICASVCGGSARPPPESDVPPVVVDAVMRGLSREPEDRFPTMDALLAELSRPLAIDPELDPTKARKSRRIAVGLLGVAASVTLASIGAFESLKLTPRGILVHGAIGLGFLTVLGVTFRKTFLSTAHNRRIGVYFLAPCIGFIVHRIVSLRLGTPVEETLIGDAISVGVASALAGSMLERWMFFGVAFAGIYVVVATVFPAVAGFSFGCLLLSCAAVAAWRWGEPKSRWPKRRDGVSGSSIRSQTTRKDR